MTETLIAKIDHKAKLRSLWSAYFSKGTATAIDHVHYFALLSAASLPENQAICYEAKTRKAFCARTNPKKLTNGGHSFLDPDFFGAWYDASRQLTKAVVYRKHKHNSIPFDGFIALAYNSVSLEVLERAAELAKHPRLSC